MKRALLLTMLLLVAPLAMVRVSLVAQQPEAAVSHSNDRQESGETATNAPKPGDNPQMAETSVLAAKRRVAEEARNAFLAHNVAYDEGTTLLESVLAWSNRWLAAELAVATTREEQLAAARKHLERMRKRRAAIKKLNDIGARGGEAIRIFTVDYFVADAERRLAEIEDSNAEIEASNDDKSTFPSRSGAFEGEPGEKRPGGGLPTTTTKPAQTSSQTLRSAPEKSSGKAGLRREWPTDASKPTVLPSQTVTLAALRYDGKTFDEWVHELQTDLSPTLRKEAMQALGEFAAHGYGKRAAEVIFDTMRGYSTWSMENSPEGHLKQAAFKAAKQVPNAELTPVVISALESDNVNLKHFALWVMPIDAAKGQIVPLLVAAVEDPDRRLAMMARTKLAFVDHDNPAIVASLRQALTSDQPAEIEPALRLVRGGQLNIPGLEGTLMPPYLQLVPEALALLESEDKKVQSMAQLYLRIIGKPLLAPLQTILSSGKASNAVRELYEEIEAMDFSAPVDRRR